MVSLKIKQLPTAVRSTSSTRKLLGPSWEEEARTEGASFPGALAVGLSSSSSVFLFGIQSQCVCHSLGY